MSSKLSCNHKSLNNLHKNDRRTQDIQMFVYVPKIITRLYIILIVDQFFMSINFRYDVTIVRRQNIKPFEGFNENPQHLQLKTHFISIFTL